MADAGALFFLVRFAIGLVIGFIVGMTSLGSGILVVPSLTLLLGLPPSVAVGTASLYGFLAKGYALVEHIRLKTVAWRVSLLFLAGAIPGNIVAALLVVRHANAGHPAEVAAFQATLKQIIAVVMIGAMVLLVGSLWRKMRSDRASASVDARRHAAQAGGAAPVPAVGAGERPLTGARAVLGVACGLVVGAVVGSTSVGAVIIVPFLVIFFGLELKRTVGSSIFITLVLTLFASVLYLSGRNMDWITALIMWAGSVAGVYAGARMSVRMPEKPLQAIVVVIIIAATVMMFVHLPAV